MPSGTAADADKPITPLVLKTPSVIGSASATLMMSRAASLAHQQDGYTNAAAPRATAERDQTRLLARGVHTRGVRLHPKKRPKPVQNRDFGTLRRARTLFQILLQCLS